MIPAQGVLQQAALAAAETTINRIMALDPAAQRLLEPLRGQAFHFAVEDLGLDLFLLPGAGRVELMGRWDGPATAALYGHSRDFLELIRAQDPAAELINSDLRLQGDSRALIQLQTALAQLEPDWEAPLARLFGDVGAHALGQGVRSGWRWLRTAGDTLRRQNSDYWREESGQLVPREAWEGFAAEVEHARQTSERLAARLARLRQWQRARSAAR